MFVPEPITSVSTKGRGVSRGEYTMFFSVNQGSFLFGKTSPEKKDNPLAVVRDKFDDSVGKSFPSLMLMATGLVGAYCKSGIKQKYSLLCPAREITTLRIRYIYILLDFLKNIY